MPKYALILLALSCVLAGCASHSESSIDLRKLPRLPETSVDFASLSDRPVIPRAKPDSPASVQELHQLLVGDWLGQQPTEEGGSIRWIMRRSGDGTFRITFRNQDATGRISESTEVGIWGVTGNLILTRTMGWLNERGEFSEAPADDPYFWDAYVFLRITPDTLHYMAVESKGQYFVTRVPVGSGFPE